MSATAKPAISATAVLASRAETPTLSAPVSSLSSAHRPVTSSPSSQVSSRGPKLVAPDQGELRDDVGESVAVPSPPCGEGLGVGRDPR